MGVLLIVALDHCTNGGMPGALIGFFLASIALGALTWNIIPYHWSLSRRSMVTLLMAAAGGAIGGFVGSRIGLVLGYFVFCDYNG